MHSTRTAGGAAAPHGLGPELSSWFVRVTQIPRPHGRTQPGDHWTPAHTKDGIFGKCGWGYARLVNLA